MAEAVKWALPDQVTTRQMQELFEFQIRLACETGPYPIEALLLHGRGDPIISDMFDRAAALYRDRYVERLVISGVTTAGARKYNIDFAGSEIWLRELIKRQVVEKDIILLHDVPDKFNTADETEAFLKLACAQDWDRLAIMAVPYHLPRCFLVMVAALNRLGYAEQMDVAALHSPATVRWDEKITRTRMTGSGIADESGPRIDQVPQEFTSFYKYMDPKQARTPHATVEEALKYLRSRDFRRYLQATAEL